MDDILSPSNAQTGDLIPAAKPPEYDKVMPITRTPLRTFLVQSKNALRTAIDKAQKVTFVIGNESADLDSLTSSLLFAYICSTAPRDASSHPPFTDLYIPLTNIHSADLRIRPEFTAVLARANVETSHLLTLDDLPQEDNRINALQPGNTKWILVDHNALQGQLGKDYGARVNGVIDHHEEESFVPGITHDEPRIVTKSGSCTSLVTEYCREAWGTLATSSDRRPEEIEQNAAWDAELAQLALASILIDTSNLTSPNVTSHDRSACDYLLSRITRTLSTFDRDAYFFEISLAKQNLDPLPLHDIFRKDYKQWSIGPRQGKHDQFLGISSVVKPISFLYNKAQKEGEASLLTAVHAYARKVELHLFALMTSFTIDGTFRREILIYVREDDGDGIEKAERFLRDGKEELGLKEWTAAPEDGAGKEKETEQWKVDLTNEAAKSSGRCRVFTQTETDKSRKAVAPLLRRALEGA